MPAQTPKTVTRLDPAAPLLWRDGQTLQLGFGTAVRIDARAPWVEPLLSRMASGFRRTGFDVLAHGAGAPRADARALLARLSPLLVDDPPAAVPAWVEGVDVADGRAEYRLREALVDEGVPLVDPGASGAAAVVLVDGAAAARRFADWLRADVRHLPRCRSNRDAWSSARS